MSADDELIEADGEGADFFDAPTIFYLTHREDIERWHALRERANRAVHEYFVSLRDDVESIVEDQAFVVDVFKTGSPFHSLLIWPSSDHELADGQPPIAIGLRWPHQRPALEDAGGAPRVGVRVAPGHKQLREQFLDFGEPDTRQLREAHGFRTDNPWPAYKEVPADPGWWADLDGYRDTLLEALQDGLSIFSDRVSSVYPHE